MEPDTEPHFEEKSPSRRSLRRRRIDVGGSLFNPLFSSNPPAFPGYSGLFRPSLDGLTALDSSLRIALRLHLAEAFGEGGFRLSAAPVNPASP